MNKLLYLAHLGTKGFELPQSAAGCSSILTSTSFAASTTTHREDREIKKLWDK